MNLSIFRTKTKLGSAAAAAGADKIREALATREEVSIVMASAASQFEVVDALLRETGIEWDRIVLFHLDEYIGLEEEHPASFSRFLRDRFVDKLPHALKGFHAINGCADPGLECARLGVMIERSVPAVAFIGIGENGHIAFNDPPADFDTKAPYIIVKLDEECRQQQIGEGWFPELKSVPEHAISMSVRQVLKAERIICTVPDVRKAPAVRSAVEEEVSPEIPATILQQHSDCRLFLDDLSASLLTR
ncbi:MAG: glucosamine-6-phosphate deaminase [Verrucomicrobia bacterium]|nr:MAG: glucosamine-6-phosphate deaminase [Verrucomicrobiota bacterium]RPF84906.1 MAG: glucosamine-6-phosphate deaminase [Roseibacillus sp. TMED18]